MKKINILSIAYLIGIILLLAIRQDFRPIPISLRQITLIPFIDYFNQDYYLPTLINDIKNGLIMFVPYSLFLLLDDSHLSLKTILIYTFLLSLSIEIIELVLGLGYFDTADIIYNLFSSIIGYYLFQCIKKLFHL